MTLRRQNDPPPIELKVLPPARRLLGAVPADAYRNWDEIYVDNVVRVYRTLYGKVGNRADAEDLTAEVFLAAYRPLRIEASRGEVRAYLLTTARTVLASFWRTTLRVEVTSITEAADFPAFNITDIDAVAVDAPKTERLARLLNGLPERQRQVLTLRFLEGRSLRDTASVMGTTIANVKVLQHRALKLASQLSKEEP